MRKHTPGPWKWEGEDYRGGWGWQLLVGPNGEGIICGEDNGHPYSHLKSHEPIEPKYCKSGAFRHRDNAPAVHVQEADARLIAAAPELLEALQRSLNWLSSYPGGCADGCYEQARAAIEKATGESNES